MSEENYQQFIEKYTREHGEMEYSDFFINRHPDLPLKVSYLVDGASMSEDLDAVKVVILQPCEMFRVGDHDYGPTLNNYYSCEIVKVEPA